MAKSSLPDTTTASNTPPTVRLEVATGGNRPKVFEVDDGGFLIGSATGCDLRLPGTNLPPVLCLITRHAAGACLRKLAPVQPIAVNGLAVSSTALHDDDRIALGSIDIVVRMSAVPAAVPRNETARRRTPDLDAKRRRLIELRDRLRSAAARIRKKKHSAIAESVRLEALSQELQTAREQFERERRTVEEQQRLVATRQQEVQREMAGRIAAMEAAEQKRAAEKGDLERGRKQHQEDVLRIDRIKAVVDKRQKQMQQRALEVDRRSEQLERDTRGLEEQAAQLDELREQLTGEREALETRKKEQTATALKLDQRAAALESQQAMLATLRTRIERMRDELRHQEQALSEQRVLHETNENDLKQRTEEARQLHLGIGNDKELFEQERRRFEERRTTLEQALARLRQVQDAQTAAEADLQLRRAELDATAAQQAEQAGVLLARGQQLDELHNRAAADRQSIGDRESAIARAETTIAALQDQLRRRDDELAERERSLKELEQRIKDETTRSAVWVAEWENQKKLGAESLDALRLELTTRAAQLDELNRSLTRREEILKHDRLQSEEDQHVLVEQLQTLQAERLAFEVSKQTNADAAAKRQAELDAARAEVLELARQLPDLEARCETVLERLAGGRDQLREHLAELHAYTKQGRDDLETARQQLRDETERCRQEEVELHRLRDEHRLAVAAFRQQIVEWQGYLPEMRQTLLRGESQLDRRHAEVEEKAQQVAAVREELAEQATHLQEAERFVEEKRGEVTRHLADMREWYRKKMRELSGIDLDEEPDVLPMPAARHDPLLVLPRDTTGGERGILIGEADPGDRQLGGLLRSLELIDAETLSALLLEARRQRRSLRQLLLAGNYLTLYQMALIEAGNLDALVNGPVRVVDRLKATVHEAVYRVFDPRNNREALLRQLSEADMQDAVRPDEFRQRFAAAARLQHPHVATTYEVLEVNGRPVVLQEWLTGVASTDWPTLASAPGVWYRLLSQAALALQTAHAAGLIHGHLQPASFVLTGDGVLKLVGLGEPAWLSGGAEEPSVAADLAALGRVAAGWAPAPPAASPRTKPLPNVLEEIVHRLESDKPGERFDSAAALLDALDQAGNSVPANAAAWERFLKQVRDQSGHVAMRRTA